MFAGGELSEELNAGREHAAVYGSSGGKRAKCSGYIDNEASRSKMKE